MDKFLQKVRDAIRTYRMLESGQPVLAALSGGADSVALLLALRTLGYVVRACHVHHGLRGAEADRDEAFCRSLCEAQRIALDVRRVDAAAHAREHGLSIETAAREVRYAALEAAAGGCAIATAHTANDNLETMLFHLARGTGAAGLAGIPPVRDRIVRPLLTCTRDEVEAFLAARGQGFVVDSTNLTGDYTRNQIRRTAVPALLALNARAAENAGALGARLRQDDDCLEREAARLLERAAGNQGWQVGVLRQAHPAVRTRALRQICAACGMRKKDLSARHIAALERLAAGEDPSARIDLPEGFCAMREYGLLKLARRTEQAVPAAGEVPVRSCGSFANGSLRVSLRRIEKNLDFYKSFNTFYVGCDTIDLSTCVLRTRRTGDRLRLTAQGGSKTLKKLLIDKKIPSARRDRLAVLADQNGLIAVQSVGIDVSRRPQGGAIFEIRFEG